MQCEESPQERKAAVTCVLLSCMFCLQNMQRKSSVEQSMGQGQKLVSHSTKGAGLAAAAVVQSLAGQSEGLHSRVSPAPGTVDACRADALEGPLCQGAAALHWPCKGNVSQ